MRWRAGNKATTDGTPFWPVNPTPMEANKVYTIELDLWNTSYVFNAGHSIRLAISSSNSPRFKANPNLGLDLNEEDKHEPKVAMNTLFYGGATPSHITLPTVTKAQLPRKILVLNKESVGSEAAANLLPAAEKLTRGVAKTLRRRVGP